MEAAAEQAVTLDNAQQEEYDLLEKEVKAIDDHLVRLHKLEDANKAAAKPINGNSEQAGSEFAQRQQRDERYFGQAQSAARDRVHALCSRAGHVSRQSDAGARDFETVEQLDAGS